MPESLSCKRLNWFLVEPELVPSRPSGIALGDRRPRVPVLWEKGSKGDGGLSRLFLLSFRLHGGIVLCLLQSHMRCTCEKTMFFSVKLLNKLHFIGEGPWTSTIM